MPKISKYPQKTQPDGHSYIVVDANVSDDKYKAQFGILNLFANRLKMQKQETEFWAPTAAFFAPFTATAIGAGTFAQIASEADHPGIWRIAGASNTGYNIGLAGATSVALAGGEIAEFVVRFPSIASVVARLGFHDTLTITAPTDRVEITLTGGAIQGTTASNGTASVTGTTYVPSVNTWYRLKIVVNSDATRVDFYVYDMSGTQLWTDFLTTNIPTGAGRETGFTAQAFKTTAGSANVLDLDWMAYYKYTALTR